MRNNNKQKQTKTDNNELESVKMFPLGMPVFLKKILFVDNI